MRESINKYLTPEELERWRNGVYGPFIPRYIAAALMGVSRNKGKGFDLYFKHLISPVILPGRSKRRALYKLSEVLALPQLIKTEPIFQKKRKRDYSFYTNIEEMIQCVYDEMEVK